MNTPDQRQRQRALTIDTSFIVQAPAGSGKTELLTQRFLALLANVEKAPEEIIAITFTRKAAAEMQARILAALQKALTMDEPEAPHARQTWQLARAVLIKDEQCQWQLLRNPNRLRIQTIDSLCASLVRRMPLLAHFGVAPQIIDNANELYQRAVRNVLQGLDTDESWSDSLATLLLHLDNDFNKVEQLLLNMLARREQWLPHILGCNAREVLEQALQHIVISAMRKAWQFFPAELMTEVLALLNFSQHQLAIDNAANTEFPAAHLNHLELWKKIITLLLTAEGSWRKKVDKRNGFPAASSAANNAEKQLFTNMKQRMDALLAKLACEEALHVALVALADVPPPYYDQQQWDIVAALVNLLPTLVAALQLEFQEQGLVDHAEIMLKALVALGAPEAPTDLALSLDYQIRHLLIDEFQDTSAAQLRLLELLTQGWQPQDGRTLFLVGDPMQSIYRFRKAEVGIFLRAWNEGIGAIKLETLLLTSNFRSDAGIVKWLNQSFKSILPAYNDIATSAVAYQNAITLNTVDHVDAVQVHPLFNADMEAEANAVVDIVKMTQANYPDQTIAILVLARSHLNAIIPALQQQQIAFRAVEIENLFQRMIVQDLYSLTCALLHPGDKLAWLAILRAPWCGLTLKELHAVVHGQGVANLASSEATTRPPLASSPSSRGEVADRDLTLSSEHSTDRVFNMTVWEQLLAFQKNTEAASQVIASTSEAFQKNQPLELDTIQRLHRFINIITAALKQRRRSSLRAWVESVWLALGGPACLSDPLDLENANTFFNLLEQQERGGEIADMNLFNQRLQSLTAQCNQDPDIKLEIMTIHKSKGLEFDRVILPGLHRAARRDDQQLLLWAEQPQDNGDSDLIIAPIKAADSKHDAIYDYLRRLEAKKAAHESGRLLYVAATRAKKNLHLMARVETEASENNLVKKPNNGSLLQHLWNEIERELCAKEQLFAIDTAVQSVSSQAEFAQQKLIRLPLRWQNPLWIDEAARPSLLTPLPGYQERGTVLSSLAKTESLSLPELSSTSTGLSSASSVPATSTVFALQQDSPSLRIIGSVTHYFLQYLSQQDLKQFNLAWITSQQDLLQQLLISYGIALADLALGVSTVNAALQHILQDKRAHWILDRQHQEAQSEFAIAAVINNELMHLVIDRTFVENGTRWIIDYKITDYRGTDLSTFLDEQQQLHLPQLQQYAAAMCLLDKRPIRLGLYFPLLQVWREIT